MSDPPSAEAFYPNLYRFALSLCKRESDACDLVQQTYWKWMKNRRRIRDAGKVRAWLFTTLYREFLRDRRRSERMEYIDDSDLDERAPAAGADAPRRLDAQLALEAMRRVPEPHRAALALFYLEDCTYLEIAEILDIAPGTVMSRIYRGKQILKRLVESDAPRPVEAAGARRSVP